MLEFINDITPFVPKETRVAWWGFMNNIVAMGKFTPREALAAILAAENMVDYTLMSIPPWKGTDPQFVLRCENFLMMFKTLVRKATTTNTAMNERAHIATQGSVVENRTPTQAPRKKILGLI